MRILIVKGKCKEKSYADVLFALWGQFFSEKNYAIKKTTGFAEAQQINMPGEKAVLIVDIAQTKFSFLSKLRLQSLIKKYKAEWVIQIGGNTVISSHRAQLIVFNNLGNIPIDKKFSSASLAVCSHIAKQKLIADKGFPEEIIHVITAAADNVYQPISWSEQQAIKMQYTQGREYFAAKGEDKTSGSFLSLLKAFSAFKKWQHSSMKLVVTGAIHFADTTEWREKIDTYKYREDIILLNGLSEEQRFLLLAGAYAFIHTPTADNDVLPLLQAMQCGTPSLSFFTDTIREYSNEASLLIEQDNYDLLSEKMILLYKDENLRSDLIRKGKQRAEFYTKEKAVRALLDTLPSHFQ